MPAERDLSDLIAKQQEYHSLDAAKQSAILPVWSRRGSHNTPVLDSLVGYVGWRTLQSLALAELPQLLDTFGAVLAGWPGSSSATTVPEALEDEEDFVGKFLEETPAKELDEKVAAIRATLASVRLEIILDPAKYALHYAENPQQPEDLSLHNRHPDSPTTIHILPPLPRLERFLKSGFLEPGSGMLPGNGLDVVVLMTAKTIVQECQHLIGLALHGTTYTTPTLVQWSFPAPPKSPKPEADRRQAEADKVEPGEAGGWYEVSRYGAISAVVLASPRLPALASELKVITVGSLSSTLMRQLEPTSVAYLATKARDGTFIHERNWFHYLSTVPCRYFGFSIDRLDHVEEAGPAGALHARAQPDYLIRGFTLQTLCLEPYPDRQITSSDGKVYGTLHGVFRGRVDSSSK
ncbi:hypothetical protein B0H16DRAFT_1880869 [Mycena metata]|uniref:Uncharacterized protein n=1 Tax=Mycena metata TaxID=1033252 RepID=A0AAD7JZA5_9AGAR|nr:hypothetical protein B0H16DRAFT_1880869 [Mycena metata]